MWTDDTIEMFYYYNSDTDVYYYYDGTNWLNMDVELYQKDLEDYEAIAERNKLRERLAEEEYSQNQKAVYYYESGKDQYNLSEDSSN